jgi:acetyl esterase
MKTTRLRPFASVSVLPFLFTAPSFAEDTFTVTLDAPVHGKFQVTPALPPDGKYAAGTVVRVTTQADPNYTFDSGYFSAPGRWGAMYYESMTPTFKVTIDKDVHVGASFIEKSQVAHLDVRQDVVYAKPGV